MNTRKYSNAQEKRIAKNLKGKKVANSGATNFFKGDVQTKKFCIECKTATTEKKSMSIKKEWIDTIKEESFGMRKPYWSIAFNFGGYDNEENYYIIDENLFKKLNNYLESEEE